MSITKCSKTSFKLAPLTCAFIAMGLSASINAEEAVEEKATGIEVIEVTSTKRITTLMETGQAVSAFSADDMLEKNITNAQDLVQYTPSLVITGNKVAIRGVGRANNALGSDPGVGIYADGVYSTENGIFDYCNFCDVERVEVLRGPQGTLYGRNSVGGAINIISKKPEQYFGGYLNAEFGNDGYQVLQGQVTGPLGETFSAIVTVSKKLRDGMQENLAVGLEDLDTTDRTYYSGTLKGDWTDNWSSSVSYMNHKRDEIPATAYLKDNYQTDFVNGSAVNFPGMFPGATAVNHLAGYGLTNPAVADISQTNVDTIGHIKSTSERFTFVNDISFGDLDLKYTYGQFDYEYDLLQDGDVTNAAYGGMDVSMMYAQLGAPYMLDPASGYTKGITLASDMTTSTMQTGESTSHELQLVSNYSGNLNFIAGLYYFNNKESQYNDYVERGYGLMQGDAIQRAYGGATDTGEILGWAPAGYYPVSLYKAYSDMLGGAPYEATGEDGGYLFYTQNNLETTSTAIYGQLEYNLTDDLTITTGLRYSTDEKEGSDEVFAYLGLAKTAHTVKDDWSKTTWRVQADWTIDNDSFLYAYVATGYRSGGFNLGSPTLDDPDVVDPEELTAYEIGYKRSLWENRVNLTAAAYYYDYTDLQVTSTIIEAGKPVTAFDNAAEASITGLELSIDMLITDNLMLNSSYSFNKSEYDDYSAVDSTACTILGECEVQDLTGNQLNMAPESKFSLNLIQFVELGDMGMLSLSAGYSWIGEQYTRSFNRDDWDKVESYDNVDARISWSSPEDTYVISAFVKNAGDNRDLIHRSAPFPDTRGSSGEYTDPVTYAIQLRYNFD
ncbi:TonB-dependent receptor [Colwellia piezophila]|uniref:TonB-dependent receptor n=1 Tax=Colwellia piezophila TaxID=211668 RepID=UPI0003765857|nr:TonB-dependent receptor [Colwellia piezophila]